MAVERHLSPGCPTCVVNTHDFRTRELGMTTIRYPEFDDTAAPYTEQLKITPTWNIMAVVRQVRKNRKLIAGLQDLQPHCTGPIDGVCPFESAVRHLDDTLLLSQQETGIITIDLPDDDCL